MKYKCEYCGQRYADTDRCCVFCGAPLPVQEEPSYTLGDHAYDTCSTASSTPIIREISDIAMLAGRSYWT
jgi:hypothetical protein